LNLRYFYIKIQYHIALAKIEGVPVRIMVG
jgi:hypothetical protein